eukprot:scaffold22529_cov61-Phaeocystis_antarctica.AAC.2
MQYFPLPKSYFLLTLEAYLLLTTYYAPWRRRPRARCRRRAAAWPPPALSPARGARTPSRHARTARAQRAWSKSRSGSGSGLGSGSGSGLGSGVGVGSGAGAVARRVLGRARELEQHGLRRVRIEDEHEERANVAEALVVVAVLRPHALEQLHERLCRKRAQYSWPEPPDLRHDLALKPASGALTGRRLSSLVFDIDGRLPVALVLEGPLGVAQENAEGRLVVAHAGGDGGGGGDAGQGRPGRQPPPQRVRDAASREEASVAPQQGRARFLLPEAGCVQQAAARQSRVGHQCRQSIRPGSRRALGRGYQERLGHLFLARVLAGGAIGRSVRALEGEATAADKFDGQPWAHTLTPRYTPSADATRTPHSHAQTSGPDTTDQTPRSHAQLSAGEQDAWRGRHMAAKARAHAEGVDDGRAQPVVSGRRQRRAAAEQRHAARRAGGAGTGGQRVVGCEPVVVLGARGLGLEPLAIHRAGELGPGHAEGGRAAQMV